MDSDGHSALHLACIKGRNDEIKKLLSAGADVNKLSKERNSPLMLVAQSNCEKTLGNEYKFECMKLLIEAGANVRIAGRGGKQAIHSAIFSRDTACVKLLLESGADASCVLEGDNNKSLLHIAAQENLPEIARLLVDLKADLNARDRLLMTPVMTAAIKHSVDALRILVAAGADVATNTCENGMNALHISALTEDKQCSETVRLLCEACAPMNNKDDRGNCAIHYHVDFQRTANVKTMLEHGCDIDLRCDAGFTPLMRACNACNWDGDVQAEMVAILLGNGADLTAKCGNGNTALSYACGKRNLKVIRALLEDVRVDVNVRDKQGDTPLHEAVIANHPETVYLLLKFGADANTSNARGETPLFLAAQHGYGDVVAVFLRDSRTVNEENRTGARNVAARKGHKKVAASIPLAPDNDHRPVDKLTCSLYASTLNG